MEHNYSQQPANSPSNIDQGNIRRFLEFMQEQGAIEENIHRAISEKLTQGNSDIALNVDQLIRLFVPRDIAQISLDEVEEGVFDGMIDILTESVSNWSFEQVCKAKELVDGIELINQVPKGDIFIHLKEYVYYGYFVDGYENGISEPVQLDGGFKKASPRSHSQTSKDKLSATRSTTSEQLHDLDFSFRFNGTHDHIPEAAEKLDANKPVSIPRDPAKGIRVKPVEKSPAQESRPYSVTPQSRFVPKLEATILGCAPSHESAKSYAQEVAQLLTRRFRVGAEAISQTLTSLATFEIEERDNKSVSRLLQHVREKLKVIGVWEDKECMYSIKALSQIAKNDRGDFLRSEVKKTLIAFYKSFPANGFTLYSREADHMRHAYKELGEYLGSSGDKVLGKMRLLSNRQLPDQVFSKQAQFLEEFKSQPMKYSLRDLAQCLESLNGIGSPVIVGLVAKTISFAVRSRLSDPRSEDREKDMRIVSTSLLPSLERIIRASSGRWSGEDLLRSIPQAILNMNNPSIEIVASFNKVLSALGNWVPIKQGGCAVGENFASLADQVLSWNKEHSESGNSRMQRTITWIGVLVSEYSPDQVIAKIRRIDADAKWLGGYARAVECLADGKHQWNAHALALAFNLLHKGSMEAADGAAISDLLVKLNKIAESIEPGFSSIHISSMFRGLSAIKQIYLTDQGKESFSSLLGTVAIHIAAGQSELDGRALADALDVLVRIDREELANDGRRNLSSYVIAICDRLSRSSGVLNSKEFGLTLFSFQSILFSQISSEAQEASDFLLRDVLRRAPKVLEARDISKGMRALSHMVETGFAEKYRPTFNQAFKTIFSRGNFNDCDLVQRIGMLRDYHAVRPFTTIDTFPAYELLHSLPEIYLANSQEFDGEDRVHALYGVVQLFATYGEELPSAIDGEYQASIGAEQQNVTSNGSSRRNKLEISVAKQLSTIGVSGEILIGERVSGFELDISIDGPYGKINVELDGRYHKGIPEMLDNRQRDNLLQSIGYHVIRVPASAGMTDREIASNVVSEVTKYRNLVLENATEWLS